MIHWWLLILIINWFPEIPPINRVAKVNRLKRLAAETYRNRDYKTALIHYRYLRYYYESPEEEVNINLAHCYFLNGDTASARKLYELLRKSPKRPVRSVAFHQLGILAYRNGLPQMAVRYFRNALRASPANELARYNYELLQKRLGQAPPPDSIRAIPPIPPVIPPPQPQDQPKHETDSTQQQINQTAQSQSSTAALGKERAEMILDAIQNQEQQYQQQMRRRAIRQSPSSYKGPDW